MKLSVQCAVQPHEIHYTVEPDAQHPGRIVERAYRRHGDAGAHALPDRQKLHRHRRSPAARGCGHGAVYHDAPEILTGDMPTPVKYKNDALRTAYKAVEHESARVMASLQPAELQAETQAWLTGSVLNDAERKILKAADRLSAIIKCIEEDRGGNREFEAARTQQMDALHAMNCPEAEYFIAHMLPCYEQNLDELTRGRF